MSASRPSEVRLTIAPERRFQAIDVNRRIAAEAGDILRRHDRAVYCSLHTTAGYLEQGIVSRLRHNEDRLAQFVGAFHAVFPPDAAYSHDRMELRSELTDAQKEVEPRNADSHLTFIGAGLRNCVTYRNDPDAPVYFVDLDGAYHSMRRTRQTTVLAYNRERLIARTSVTVPVSRHPIDSINLANPRVGLFDRMNELLERSGVEFARVDLAIQNGERHAGLTVNEYETLLMQHDLIDVLRNPLRFARIKAQNIFSDPRAIPGKTLSYAKYDVVRVLNRLMEALRLDESALERLVAKIMAVPARRFIRTRRVSFLASRSGTGSAARILRGAYQSPILVQWRPAAGQARTLELSATELS